MRRERITTGFSALCAAALLAAPAGAATPAQMYKDLAAHGKLTKHYSQADLRAFQRNAAVQGYGSPVVTVVLHAVPQAPAPKVLAARKTVGHAPLATQATRSTLPFTGQDLGLFALAGVLLLGSGLLLRATARRRPNE